jgi:folate-binding protein YgfZ
MEQLILRDFHQKLSGRFIAVNGVEVVGNYGDVANEYEALGGQAGILDFSFRGRICLTGNDRVRFLHGQVTNDVKKLKEGEGCYAALVTAKGRTECDLNIYSLAEELLLDFEPGLSNIVSQRLEKYVIADDVQIVDVATLYGLLSVQGPHSPEIIRAAALTTELPAKALTFAKFSTGAGEGYLINQPRLGSTGFDLFLPVSELQPAIEKLVEAARRHGGRLAGWQAVEIARIEAGIPRFGADIDASNIPLEAGIDNRAISFSKGCYIGQEVISRIKTYSEVSKSLRGLFLEAVGPLPLKGDKLFHAGKEVGYVTSAVQSLKLKAPIALGYVRKEVNQPGTELAVRTAAGDVSARIVELPFKGGSIPS